MTHRVTTVADAVDGLNEDHVCTVHGRFVMDLLGKVWKLRWLGLGTSCFWADDFDGWSVGADVRFKF